MYLVDERNFLIHGIELTSSKYLVWKKGPVNEFVYNDLQYNNGLHLKKFVTIDYSGNRVSITNPGYNKAESLFTETEIEIIESVLLEFMAVPTPRIIDELHNEESLWYKTAYQEGLLQDLKDGTISTTDVKLDFKKLLVKGDNRLELNGIIKENLLFQEALG